MNTPSVIRTSYLKTESESSNLNIPGTQHQSENKTWFGPEATGASQEHRPRDSEFCPTIKHTPPEDGGGGGFLQFSLLTKKVGGKFFRGSLFDYLPP
ncbi:hypothetical protein J6590_048582 [Homalodisca vitripennis]|nr:hypothetical protein J6590_048582 [Homalodisca vitripennis]